MADTLVDRRDMDFVLYEQLDISTLTRLERFSHLSKDEFDMVLEQALKFARNDLAPTNADGDLIGAQWKEGNVILPKSFHGPSAAVCRTGVGCIHRGTRGGWTGTAFDPLYCSL